MYNILSICVYDPLYDVCARKRRSQTIDNMYVAYIFMRRHIVRF